MLEVLTQVLAWTLVVLFALVLGAQAFDAFVLVPLWSAHPPDSLDDFLQTPAAARVPRYFARLLPVLLIVSLAVLALLPLLRAAASNWLFVAAACGLIHVGLVAGFFIPTNRRLGFLPSASAATPSEKIALVHAWVRWNYVRLVLDLLGLVSAARGVV